jgi:small G protein signaling modulator 3
MGDAEASPPLSESGGDKMTRTSSQTSGASTNSKKTYPARRTPKTVSKSSSASSLKRDPSLTSFPSLSPEHVSNQQDVPKLQSPPQPTRTTSQKARDRKKTLASLTSASGSFQGQSSLFDDSPRSSLDIPGALHLASDEHIERLIARSGAVKLVRQFAQDLALRDAELSSLRSRADERERELKKMLRDAEVPSTNIERRLHSLENTSLHPAPGVEARTGVARNITTRIDDMMHQAMAEEVGLENDRNAVVGETHPSATVRPIKSDDFTYKKPTTDSSRSRNRGESESGSQFWSANQATPTTSGASSVLEEDIHNASATAKPRTAGSNTKRRGLDSILQPATQSSSYFIGGVNKTVKKSTGDDASVHSQKSNRSLGWTKIFAGTGLAAKEDAGRPRSSSLEQDKTGGPRTSAAASESAMLSRVRTNPAKGLNASKSNTLAPNNTLKARPTGRRTPTIGAPAGAEHTRRDSDATSLGPVEMDTILDAAAKPPTMTHSYNNYQSEDLLTDRFGFIYDQRQRKRQKQALSTTQLNRLSGMSGMESLSSFRSDSDSADETIQAKPNGALSSPRRSETPGSVEEEYQPKKWSDYLKVPSKMSGVRPTELLSHTPSAGAVVTVSTADASGTITPPRAREISISIKSQLALPITSFVPKPSQSGVTADSPTFANNQNHIVTSVPDQEPVKLLLEQLTELHDTLQAEREVKFNDFLRKVRAERSTTASSDRASNNVPEADIPNGELIGDLGHAKNRTKYLQFRALVLGGIPVSLRPRIWAECSGASTLRIPGYYEDLVTRSRTEMDPEIEAQIAADVPRSLTDNSMFRFGPGKGKLTEILKAYSLHNPAVGYCQGMNLITGSLLLICVTSEDVFWLLCAIVDKIMPSGYFDRGLRSSRADQVVLRSYVSEVLPKLDAKLEELGVELEACTFQWFLSLYSAVVSAEPLFRIWDVVLCLNSSESQPQEATGGETALPGASSTTAVEGNGEEEWHDGTCSPFLFQLSLALLKLNEASLLVCCRPCLMCR